MTDPKSLIDLFDEITISREDGSLDRKHRPATEMKGVIVCLQDLHANPGVQRKIAAIVDALAVERSFRNIYVEGTWELVDSTIMKLFPDADIKKEAMSFLLEQGELTGAEYASCLRPELDINLYGVDDEQLFKANKQAGADLVKVKDQVAADLNELKRVTYSACEPLLSRDFLDFSDIIRAYSEDRLTYTDYGRQLYLYNKLNNLAPNETLARHLHERGLLSVSRRDLTAHSLSGTSSADDSFEKELRSEILARLCQTELDRRYLRLFADADLINTAFQARLTAEQARRFLGQNVDDVKRRVMDDLAFITNCVRRNNVHASRTLASFHDRLAFLWDSWSIPRTFYRAAKSRSHIMAKRTAEDMAQRGVDRAILVVGGFHAFYSCRDLVRNSGIACITVFPRVENVEAPNYWRLIAGNLLTTEEILAAASARNQAENPLLGSGAKGRRQQSTGPKTEQ